MIGKHKAALLRSKKAPWLRIILADVLFYFIVALAMALLFPKILSSLLSLQNSIHLFNQLTPDMAGNFLSDLKGTYAALAIAAICIPLIFITAFTLSRVYIWKNITGSKHGYWRLVLSFLAVVLVAAALKLILFLPFFMIQWALIEILDTNAMSIVILLLMIIYAFIFMLIGHLWIVLQPYFIRYRKVKKALIIGLMNIHHYVVGYLLISMVLIAALIILKLVFLIPFPPRIVGVILILAMICLLNWSKNYIWKLTEELTRQ